MTLNNKSHKFDLLDIVHFLIRWRKPLLGFSMAGAVIAAVTSLLLPSKYQSQAVVFPSSNGSFSGAFLSEITSKDINMDPLAFGQEEHAEQLLQILQSDYVRSSVINQFKLMEHYEINPSSKGADLKLAKKYEGNVKIKRNQYTAIEVTVTDKDPQFAADIANAIVAYADSAKTNMLRKYAQKALNDMEIYLAQKAVYIEEVKDSLNSLGAQGIIAPDEQVKGLMEQMVIASTKGDTRTMNMVDERIKKIGALSGDFFKYNRILVEEAQKQADLRKKYEQLKVNVESGLPSNFSVNKAWPPGDRSWPVRWLIVAISTIATFVTAFILLLVYEQLYLPLRKQLHESK